VKKGHFALQVLQLVRCDRQRIPVPDRETSALAGFERSRFVIEEQPMGAAQVVYERSASALSILSAVTKGCAP
jgi:hypothetical protein